MSVPLNVTLSKNQWADKSPYTVAPTDVVSFLFTILDVTEITSTGIDTKLWLDGTDVSSGNLTGSTTVVSPNGISSEVLGGTLSPGSEYVLAVYGTADGQLRLCGKIKLIVRSDGDNQ